MWGGRQAGRGLDAAGHAPEQDALGGGKGLYRPPGRVKDRAAAGRAADGDRERGADLLAVGDVADPRVAVLAVAVVGDLYGAPAGDRPAADALPERQPEPEPAVPRPEVPLNLDHPATYASPVRDVRSAHRPDQRQQGRQRPHVAPPEGPGELRVERPGGAAEVGRLPVLHLEQDLQRLPKPVDPLAGVGARMRPEDEQTGGNTLPAQRQNEREVGRAWGPRGEMPRRSLQGRFETLAQPALRLPLSASRVVHPPGRGDDGVRPDQSRSRRRQVPDRPFQGASYRLRTVERVHHPDPRALRRWKVISVRSPSHDPHRFVCRHKKGSPTLS